MPPPNYASGIARIVAPAEMGEKHIGMAVVVGDRHVMTCCHVLNDALNATRSEKRDRLDRAPPPDGTRFEVRFPYVARVTGTGRVIKWGLSLPQPRDVAVLELDAQAPADASFAEFSPHTVPIGKPWICNGWNAEETERGARGEFGPLLSDHRLQLNGESGRGVLIGPGYSGAGVWSSDLKAFVGMVVTEDWEKYENGLAYALPATVLLGLWPQIRMVETPSTNEMGFRVSRGQLWDHLRALSRDPTLAKWGAASTKHEVSGGVPPFMSRYKDARPSRSLLLPYLASRGARCRILLLGEPGLGKTSSLQLFARGLIDRCAKADNATTCVLPIITRLRDYAGEPSLLPLVRDHIRQYGQLLVSEEEVEAILDQVACVVMLDGLNEVAAEHREAVTRAINRLVKASPRAGYVLTCRTTDYPDFEAEATGFEVLELCKWEAAQARQYLTEFAPGMASLIPEQVEALVRSPIASTPLMLQFAVAAPFLADRPVHQADVIRAFLHSPQILGPAAVSRGIRQTLLPTARRLAHTMHSGRRLKIGLDELFQEMELVRGRREYSLEEMLAALHKSGIVQSDLQAAWFSHEYVQEYLCAEYLAEGAMPEQVAVLAEDPWWRQTAGLYLRTARLPADALLGFLRPRIDRWVRYEAGVVLGESGDPRLGRMVRIPAGRFVLGRDDGPLPERPAHPVDLAEYEIDAYPVTNVEYRRFLEQTGHPPPPHWDGQGCPQGKANHPVVNVGWSDALAYATWAGKRLPTEAEWEKAASWFEDHIKYVWPWGDEFHPRQVNSDTATRYWVGGTTPVGIFPGGASRYGLFDLSGNVWEWTSSAFADYPYDPADGREDPLRLTRRVVRGGSWRSVHPDYLTATRREAFQPRPEAAGNVGFRCARNL